MAETSNDDVKTMSFEAALGELEKIVGTLESGKAPLAESIEIYARGEALKSHCEALLKAAPDLVISGSMAQGNTDFEAFFTSLNIPVAHIDSGSPEAYPKALRVLGAVLGRNKRNRRLQRQADMSRAMISGQPELHLRACWRIAPMPGQDKPAL